MNGMYAFSKLEMVWSTIKSCDKQSAQKQKVVWIDESGYETKINIERHWFDPLGIHTEINKPALVIKLNEHNMSSHYHKSNDRWRVMGYVEKPIKHWSIDWLIDWF